MHHIILLMPAIIPHFLTNTPTRDSLASYFEVIWQHSVIVHCLCDYYRMQEA